MNFLIQMLVVHGQSTMSHTGLQWPYKPKRSGDAKLPPKLVKLPLYPPTKPSDATQFRFIEDDPLPGEDSISAVRETIQETVSAVAQRFGIAKQSVDSASSSVSAVRKHYKEDSTALVKASAIVVGGMSGFLYAYLKKGRFVGRSVYTGVGALTMAAFCYPHEAVDCTRRGYRTVNVKWQEFYNPPTPPQSQPVTGTITSDKHDADMYTTRSPTTTTS